MGFGVGSGDDVGEGVPVGELISDCDVGDRDLFMVAIPVIAATAITTHPSVISCQGFFTLGQLMQKKYFQTGSQ